MSENHSPLISAARKYFASDFPVEGANVCPNHARLDKLIKTRSLPPDDISEHLFNCSQCFEYFQTRLAASRITVAPTTAWKNLLDALTGKWLPWVTAALFAAAGLSGFALWRYMPSLSSKSSPTLSQTSTETKTVSGTAITVTPTPSPQATPSLSPTPATNATLAPRPALEGAPPPVGKGAAIAAQLVSIDLRGRQLLRGGEETAVAQPIRATATRNQLSIRLPEESPRGAYEVRLVDAFDNTVVAGRARSPDGKSLSVVLDMRALPARSYRLCLARAEGAPSCFPFVLEGKR